MKTAKHIILLICILSLILSLSLIATAEEVQPLGFPTLTSTRCPTCLQQMTFDSQICETSTTRVSNASCDNSQNGLADETGTHLHYLYYYYDIYYCSNCSIWGRLFSYKDTDCQGGMK